MLNLTKVSEWEDGHFHRKDDYLAAEEPLEIRVGGEPLSVTMRTPGHDLELAAGFLFSEGIVRSADQIISLQPGVSGENPKVGNLVQAELLPEVAPDFATMQRHFFAASSCGICGKASIDSVRSRLLKASNPDFRCAPELLVKLPDVLRSSQDVFQRTRILQSRHLAVTTSVQNRTRHCEEGEATKFPAVLHYLTPWLEPLPVGSSQFLFRSFGGRLLRRVCFYRSPYSPGFFDPAIRSSPE